MGMQVADFLMQKEIWLTRGSGLVESAGIGVGWNICVCQAGCI